MRSYKRQSSLSPLDIENAHIVEIIRWEYSAVEAYKKLMAGISEDPHLFRLRQFYLNHQDNLQYWKKEGEIAGSFETASVTVWAKAVEYFIGVTTLIGDKTALKSILKGEEYALTKYQNQLDSDLLTPLQKSTIRKSLIPRQKRHIDAIEKLISEKQGGSHGSIPSD